MKYRLRLVILGLIVLLLAPFFVPIFSPWSAINCRDQEIDLLTGLRRDTRYLFWIPISQKISSTSVSKVLILDEFSKKAHQWKLVNTFGPYTRHSPNHLYHGAFNEINSLEMIWEEWKFDVAERQSSAQGLLHLWQTSGSNSSASSYLQELMKKAEQAAP